MVFGMVNKYDGLMDMRKRLEDIGSNDVKAISSFLHDFNMFLLEAIHDVDVELKKGGLRIFFVMEDQSQFDRSMPFTHNLKVSLHNFLTSMICKFLSPHSKEKFLPLRVNLAKLKMEWDTHFAYFEAKHGNSIYVSSSDEAE